MNKKSGKLLSLLLAGAMMIGVMPTSAFAAEETADNNAEPVVVENVESEVQAN